MDITQIGKMGKYEFKQGDIIRIETIDKKCAIGEFQCFASSFFKRKEQIRLAYTDFARDEDDGTITIRVDLIENIEIIKEVIKEEQK